MITEVPRRLSSTNSRNRRSAIIGSTLPVGSSASRSSGRADHGAGDRRALLLAAGQDLGVGVDAVAKPDPAQQIGHVLAIVGLLLAHHAQGQRHVLPGGEMVEQAEILEHDADAAPKLGAAARRRGRTTFSPKTKIRPRVGRSDMNRRRNSVVLPAPDGPVRK